MQYALSTAWHLRRFIAVFVALEKSHLCALISHMDESPIQVNSRTLNDVMLEMGRGVLRIPRFQRDYVWEATRVAKLFDSIYKGFPIGSFFYWITPQEYRDHYREIPELKLPVPPGYDQIKMILDGQHLTTLKEWAVKRLSQNML